MATIDMTQATQAISMSFDQFVAFRTPVENTATSWSWFTPGGNDIDLDGSGLTYGANGKALSGTINLIAIDVGNNSESNPDILIRNLSVAAIGLDDSSEGFWKNVLAGDDTILGPSVAKAGTQSISQIFGDREDVFLTGGRGGDDLIRAGDTRVAAAGDTLSVDSRGNTYRGGDDDIFTAPTALLQLVVGDANEVESTGILAGGDDFLIIRSSHVDSAAIGDAQFARDGALVIGGDDRIAAADGARAQLIGDVLAQGRNSRVEGGDDTINGGALGEEIVGDVHEIDEVDSATVIGGDDTLDGKGGDDVIGGDAFFAVPTVGIFGGADTIRGGEGDDKIFGELAIGSAVLTGGDDQLFGDAGNDQLFGQSGDDTLDGGTENDLLSGGAGVDTLSGGGGADELRGDAGNDTLDGGAGIDRLIDGAGNDTVFGGADADTLVAGAGLDRLDGGDGADRLFAEAGAGDTFVFASAVGIDRVFNFASGLHDLAIDASVFGGVAGSFVFRANANPVAPSATRALLYDTDDGKLWFDADGNGAGAPVHVLTLAGAPTLAAADLALV